MKLWFSRYAKSRGICLCLVKFDNIDYYVEIDFTYFLKRRNKKIKLSSYNLSHPHYHQYYCPVSDFPVYYKNSFEKGYYMEGKVIYNHEVVRRVLDAIGISSVLH